MKSLNISMVLALSGGLLIACGDDSGDKMQSNDASVADSAVPKADSSTPAADAGAGDSAVDSGVNVVKDSGTSMDSGAQDSGTKDSAVQDSSMAGNDAGSLLSSAQCSSCVTSECTYAKVPQADPSVFSFCSSFAANDVAKGGQKMGSPRKELCESVGACFASSGCSNPLRTPVADGGVGYASWFSCLCGTQDPDACFGIPMASQFKGPCVDQLFNAAETTDVQTFFERAQDPAYPIGRASYLYNCQTWLCADECFAPCTGQADGLICNATTSNALSEGKCMANKCTDNPKGYSPF